MRRDSPDKDRHDGRLMLGVGGLLFIPLTATGTWFLLFELPEPQGPLEWGIRIFLDELALVATFFFSVGFLWAISGNQQLKKLLDAASVKFAWLLIPLAIPLFAAVVSILILG